jgi:ferredoxin
VADGRFDVMLLVYSFVQQEMGERILKACAEKKIGTTLMKTKPVDKYAYYKERIETRAKEKGEEISQGNKDMLAAFKKRSDMAIEFMEKKNIKDPREIRDAAVRFALKNPMVNTVCINFRSFDDIDPYIKLSGSSMTAVDKKKLALYLEGCGRFYCRHACGICESKCPHRVPVNTIMRYNHYFTSQGLEKYAMDKYAALPTAKADLCGTCAGMCESACPYNVYIHGMLTHAHSNLSPA